MKSLPTGSLLFFLAVGGLLLTACSQTEKVVMIKPTGLYASIETQTSMDALDTIGDKKTASIKQIRQDIGNYQPPVLYLLANYLFEAGEKEEAMYYFYLG